jgi:hypothetical protein
LLGVLFSISSVAWAVDGNPVWTRSLIINNMPPNTTVSSPVLAFDHYGTPGVSWSLCSATGGNNTVWCSQLSGMGFWTHHQLATGQGIGAWTALTFDRAERPIIGWVNSDGTVKGQFNFGTTQQIGTGANASRAALSMECDLAGDLRGMFAKVSPAGNFFAIGYSGGNFNSTNMVTINDGGTIIDAAMTTDQRDGLRHLIAREDLDGGGEAVVVASESTSGDWGFVRLITATEVKGVDIAVDPTDGRVALAYTTFDTGPDRSTLWYAKFNGVTLVPQSVLEPTTDSLEDVSLAFDLSDGRPAIAFERFVSSTGHGNLQFAYLDAASQWQTSVVDDDVSLEASMPRRPSLAFDDYATSWPAIAYIDGGGYPRVAFDPAVPEPASLGLLSAGLVLLPRRREPRTDC